MHIPPAAFLRVNPGRAARRAGLGRPRPRIRHGSGTAGRSGRKGAREARLLPSSFARGSAGVGAGNNPRGGRALSGAPAASPQPGGAGSSAVAAAPRGQQRPGMTDTGASHSLSANLPRPCIGWRRRLCRGARPGPGSAGNVPREKAATASIPLSRGSVEFPLPNFQVPLTSLHILVNSR